MNKSEILFISEANMDTDDDKKMAERERDFPDFDFLDKKLPGSDKSRTTVMIT